MNEKLMYINNELQQIYVRGVDTVHMAKALQAIAELVDEEQQKAAQEQKTED